MSHGHDSYSEKILRNVTFHESPRFRLSALQASQQLPENYKSQFIQGALSDDQDHIVLTAIHSIKATEDENLYRWLVKKVGSDNHQVSCAASQSFSHFFREEEAYIITKYSALPPLIRATEQQHHINKRICAIEALGYSEAYRALTVLLDLSESPLPLLKQKAITALGLLKERGALTRLIAIASNIEESDAIRESALASIRQIAPNHQALSPFNKSTSPILVIDNEKENKKLPYVETKNIVCFDENLRKIETLINVDDQAFCLEKTKFYKAMPLWLSQKLSQQPSIHITTNIAIAIAPRKEQWARQITETILQDKNLSLPLRRASLDHLPQPLSVGNNRILNKLFFENEALSPYIAKYFINKNVAVDKKSLNHLERSISNKDYSAILALSDALLPTHPQEVLDLLIGQP